MKNPVAGHMPLYRYDGYLPPVFLCAPLAETDPYVCTYDLVLNTISVAGDTAELWKRVAHGAVMGVLVKISFLARYEKMDFVPDLRATIPIQSGASTEGYTEFGEDGAQRWIVIFLSSQGMCMPKIPNHAIIYIILIILACIASWLLLGPWQWG
jgi:hypothetical protein